MAYLRSSAFKSLLRTRASSLCPQQRRWAQVHDVRFLATHHDPNQVLDRYRSKLKQKAQAEGHQDIDSLKEAYKEKIEEFRHKATTPLTPEPPKSSPSPSTTGPSPPPPPPTPQARAASSATSTGIRPLDSFIDVEKVRGLPAKEIEAIWRLRFANNSHSVCAVIPVETYQRIVSAARQNPQFVLPLPRTQSEAQTAEENAETAKGGADIHFLQWGFHPPASPTASSAASANDHTSTIIFTALASYQLHGSYAQPHTTVTHYLDLADEKGLVLMNGQVMPDSGVSATDATWLVSCVQRFYDFGGQANGRKGELLQAFTRGDVQNFKVEDLMAEAEKL
ncbi:F1F0 ATP synthase assembly protein Atp11 [Aspergillus costaricaensis CBS 115574]|uniref:F1F0 ATP synthase assembly protein Atp11 n=1 Tax=Aspergillus costaricaensis CBS 115574 TaxID=1448317 RepID=A0ACD1IV03_9EURO|nr:F1F0 ATP synthase assembly protein Atp11 [Aspergillus costaricaensis CBS 115574]RAK94541.1 F1F0 ATP synthase assembly protein Atp11 [Aspergillus costaricaensis CBS 115574]